MNISADTTGEKIALNMTVTTGIVGARKHTSEMFVLQDYGRVSSIFRHLFLLSCNLSCLSNMCHFND